MFDGINASVFREPEAFLQLLIFTELRKGDAGTVDKDSVADPGGSKGTPGRYAYTGKRHPASDTPSPTKEDIQIDNIPDGDVVIDGPVEDESGRKKSSEISYTERKKGRKP